jgi:hypothetical protein
MSIKSKSFLLIISALVFVFLAIIVIFSDFSKVSLVQKFEKFSGQKVIQSENETKVVDPNSEEEIFIELTNPKDKDVVKTSLLNIKGKTVKNAEVFINDKEIKADALGSFSANLTLDEGENTIIISANDNLGNYIEKEITVTLESF